MASIGCGSAMRQLPIVKEHLAQYLNSTTNVLEVAEWMTGSDSPSYRADSDARPQSGLVETLLPAGLAVAAPSCRRVFRSLLGGSVVTIRFQCGC